MNWWSPCSMREPCLKNKKNMVWYWGWSDISIDRNACCSFREWEFSSQLPCWGVYNLPNSTSRGSSTLFGPWQTYIHTCTGKYIHAQVNTHVHTHTRVCAHTHTHTRTREREREQTTLQIYSQSASFLI